jgi:hypothetical protein
MCKYPAGLCLPILREVLDFVPMGTPIYCSLQLRCISHQSMEMLLRIVNFDDLSILPQSPLLVFCPLATSIEKEGNSSRRTTRSRRIEWCGMPRSTSPFENSLNLRCYLVGLSGVLGCVDMGTCFSCECSLLIYVCVCVVNKDDVVKNVSTER